MLLKPKRSSASFLIHLIGNFYGSSAKTNMAAVHPAWVWIDHKRIPETLRAALVKEKFVHDRLGFLNGKPTWLSLANGEPSIKKALSSHLCDVKYAFKLKTVFKILKQLVIFITRPFKRVIVKNLVLAIQ